MSKNYFLLFLLLTFASTIQSQDDTIPTFGEGFIIPDGAWIISDNGNYGYFQQIIFNEDFSVDNTHYQLGFVDLTSDTIEPRILEIHAPLSYPQSSLYVVNPIDMSPDEKFLAVHDNTGVTIYSVADLMVYSFIDSEMPNESNDINELQWSIDGRYLAATGISGVRVWDSKTDLIYRRQQGGIQGPITAFEGGWVIHFPINYDIPSTAFSSCDLLLKNCVEYYPQDLSEELEPETHARVIVAEYGNTIITRVKQTDDQWLDWVWYRQDNHTWKSAEKALPEVHSNEHDPQVMSQDGLFVTTTVCNISTKSDDLDRQCRLALFDTQQYEVVSTLPKGCGLPLFLSQNYYMCGWQLVGIPFNQTNLQLAQDTLNIRTKSEFVHLFRMYDDTYYDQYNPSRINGSGNFLSLALKNRVAPFDLITLFIPIEYDKDF